MPNTYATVQKVKDSMGESHLRSVLDVDGAANLDTNAQLALAIARANAEADTMLRGIVKLPLAAAEDVCGHVVNLVRWYLLEKRPDIFARGGGDDDRMRYNDAVKYLKLISGDKPRVDVNPTSNAPLPGRARVAKMGGDNDEEGNILPATWGYR